ncbi:autotransporter outer membrane beta-barrel domain-containing protein, partial [Methylopila musalis]
DAGGKGGLALALGALGGAGGDAGNVEVIRTGSIVTEGRDSVAIIAQSVGGGGGIGGAGFGRFSTDGDGDGPDSIGFKTPGGDRGDGGTVRIVQTGEILATGARSHGVVAQAVGGGGGFGGLSSLALGQSGAGSRGGVGDAAAVTATANDTIVVRGASSYALFGQSATGQGDAGAVTLTAGGSLAAQGADSVAVYAESSSAQGKGNITVTLNGARTIGGSGTGQAALFVGGADNLLTNKTLMYALGADVETEGVALGDLIGDFSARTLTATFGDDQIDNIGGRVIGDIDLGTGVNGFRNDAASSFIGLRTIATGPDGAFVNEGLMSNHGVGEVGRVDLTGGYGQTGTGRYVVDIDLNSQTTDRLDITGTGAFAGTAPLNFLSIDQLFESYVIASAADGMTNAGVSPTFRPAVGFEFTTTVENGVDLVLSANKPLFRDLANDPASGVKDPNAVGLGSYLDGVEAAASPVNPMARLINMLRFSPDAATLGAGLMRLTPHYAVHSLEMVDRAMDEGLDVARRCGGGQERGDPLARCVWFSFAPDTKYSFDRGTGYSDRDDRYRTFTFGGRAAIADNWALGFSAAHTDYTSRIGFGDAMLSSTKGDGWQFFGLAKFAKGGVFADFTLGGGKASFSGARDTSLAQVAFTPGETLEGAYLPDELHPGIGNSVRYRQSSRQFGLSARLGYTLEAGAFYAEPQVLLDGRWIEMDARERGSVAAINFRKQTTFAFSATPGVELGAKLPVAEGVHLDVFARGGMEFQRANWRMEGQFAAVQGVLDAPPLVLRQKGASPLWRVGAGVKLSTDAGVDISAGYNGAFGDDTTLNGWNGRVAVRF